VAFDGANASRRADAVLAGEAMMWLDWSGTAVVEGAVAVVLMRESRARLERDEIALGLESSAVRSEDRSRRVSVACDGALLMLMDDAAVLMTMR
jgi:hypothetical protein